MKRWILLLCFLVSLGWGVVHYGSSITQGNFSSIILDFREEVGDSQIQQALSEASQRFDLKPRLNSEFSESDHVFIVPGEATLLRDLRRSGLDRYTESIEPNYNYSVPEASQVRLPIPVDNPIAANKSADRSTEKSQVKLTDKLIDKSTDKFQAQPPTEPNDPLFKRQWNLKQINIESAWIITKGKGSIVAVVGTGISRVSDLETTDFLVGYDFVNDNADATDDHGHGTHIAGTIAQSTNNAFGSAGIAPEASLMPIKVLSIGGNGTVADIAEGIRYAADHGAHVINLTMVGDGNSLFLQKAIDYADRKGAVIISPAGNSGRTAAAYPARYRHVLGVAALDIKGQKAPYSNGGAGVDISAPGGWIEGEDPTGGIIQNTFDRRMQVSIFAPYQGTSMAAPHVSGVAALIHSMGITDPGEISTLLIRSVQRLPRDARNDYGAGKLDASAALKLAQQPTRPPPNLFDQWRDRGYIDARLWLDEEEIAAPSKLMMAGITLILAWSLGQLGWNGLTWLGMLLGSCGLFLVRGIYLMDVSQLPFRILGSTLPELWNVFQGDPVLNPLTASVLVPALLGALSVRIPGLKPGAVGLCLGMTASLLIYSITDPALEWIASSMVARIFLFTNSLLCWMGARYLMLPWTDFVQGMVQPWQFRYWQGRWNSLTIGFQPRPRHSSKTRRRPTNAASERPPQSPNSQALPTSSIRRRPKPRDP
ncbi:MAG: peptidase S8 [Alkalinema sp. FL-bin-369]|nr:peptidase S8 [Leptolyngbyaceae cyanobacterium LF-bin-369]